jgi:hypothetical protein
MVFGFWVIVIKAFCISILSFLIYPMGIIEQNYYEGQSALQTVNCKSLYRWDVVLFINLSFEQCHFLPCIKWSDIILFLQWKFRMALILMFSLGNLCEMFFKMISTMNSLWKSWNIFAYFSLVLPCIWIWLTVLSCFAFI